MPVCVLPLEPQLQGHHLRRECDDMTDMRTRLAVTSISLALTACGNPPSGDESDDNVAAPAVSEVHLGLPAGFGAEADLGGLQLAWAPGEPLVVVGSGSTSCLPEIEASSEAGRIVISAVDSTRSDQICTADVAVFWVAVDVGDDLRAASSLIVEIANWGTVELR